MRRIMIVASALMMALGGCAITNGPGVRDTASIREISLTVRSWGRVVHEWRIASDGTGSFTEAVGQPGPNGAQQTRTKALAIGAEGFARIASLSASAEEAARGVLPCDRQITDMPYGMMQWKGASGTTRYAFDLGCRAPEAIAANEALTAADTAVRGYAEQAPVEEPSRR